MDLIRATDADFLAALTILARAKGIVFDLRGYPRLGPDWLTYLSDKPLKSTDWLSPIYHYPDRQTVVDPYNGGRWQLEPKETRLTTNRVFLTDRSQHHGVGIQLTVRVANTITGIAEGRDEQLEKALELLK